MKIRIFDDPLSMAKAAADHAAEVIQQALAERGQARIVASTGESQVDFLHELIAHRDMDWANVESVSAWTNTLGWLRIIRPAFEGSCRIA